jgi:hypothetical protein
MVRYAIVTGRGRSTLEFRVLVGANQSGPTTTRNSRGNRVVAVAACAAWRSHCGSGPSSYRHRSCRGASPGLAVPVVRASTPPTRGSRCPSMSRDPPRCRRHSASGRWRAWPIGSPTACSPWPRRSTDPSCAIGRPHWPGWRISSRPRWRLHPSDAGRPGPPAAYGNAGGPPRSGAARPSDCAGRRPNEPHHEWLIGRPRVADRRQERPTMSPFSSMSTRCSAGAEPRPGMVRISPQMG